MSRSVKKGPFVDPRLLGRIEEMNKRNERKVLKTWSRASVIFPAMIRYTIAVHDGRRAIPVYVTRAWSATAWASSPPPATSADMGGIPVILGAEVGIDPMRVSATPCVRISPARSG